METYKNIPAATAKNRHEWRRWLMKNHQNQTSVWLVFYNQSAQTPTVTYAEAVEEALCFGWIDSVVNKRDAHSRYQFFSPRKTKSNWSKLNRQRAEAMIAAGQMTPSGQALIDLAKQNGNWVALDGPEENLLPPDLEKALERNKKAMAFFGAFPPSSKRIILEWIMNAKRPETRKKRIRETVQLAAQNKRANHYTRKNK